MNGKLTDELAAARARVATLERQVAAAPCREVGHRWKQMGGANCGCPRDVGWCSVPVHECAQCGDCDYGDNPVANAMRDSCDCRREWQEPTNAGE